MRRQSAFTLIEALIVLSIITLLTLLTVSGLRDVLQRSQDIAVRAELIELITSARNEAALQHKTVILCKSRDVHHCGGQWSEGQLVFVDVAHDGEVHAPEQIIAVNRMDLSKGSLHARFYPLYRDAIHFNALGSAINDNGSFWYCRVGKTLPSWAIKINRAGNIEEMLPDKNGEIMDAKSKALLC